MYSLQNKQSDKINEMSNILRFGKLDRLPLNLSSTPLCILTIDETDETSIIKIVNYQYIGHQGKIDMKMCMCDNCRGKIRSASHIWLDSNQFLLLPNPQTLSSVTWYVCPLTNTNNASAVSIVYLRSDVSDTFLSTLNSTKGQFVEFNMIVHNEMCAPLRNKTNTFSIPASLKCLALEKMNHFEIYNYIYSGYGTIEWEKFEWVVGLLPIHCSSISYDIFENLNPKSPSGFYILYNTNNSIHIHKNVDTDAIYISNSISKISINRNLLKSHYRNFNRSVNFCLGCHDAKWELLPTNYSALIFVKMCQYLFPAMAIKNTTEEIIYKIKSLKDISCGRYFNGEVEKFMRYPKRKLKVSLHAGTYQSNLTLKFFLSSNKNLIAATKYILPIAFWSDHNILYIHNCSKLKLYFKFGKNEENFYIDSLHCSFAYLDMKTEIYVYTELNITEYINTISIEQM